MKVLQVGKFFPPARGGIETVLRFLTLGLSRRRGIDLEVLVFNEKPVTSTEVFHGVPVTRLARWEQLFSVPVAPSMYWWLKSRRYDVVHLHVPNPLAAVCILLTNPGEKLVISYHSDIVKQRLLLKLYAPFQRRLLKKADSIIVSSRSLLENGKGLMDFAQKASIVPFGIDPGPYLEPDRTDLEDRAKVMEEIGGPFVLFAGRLVYYKGLQYLLQAVKKIGCRLVIAGDGPFYANLRLLAAGMAEQVVFCGDVTDRRLRSLMACCDVFVLPSISSSETFGLVQLEAMASGKPVVNTALSTGVPEVSTDGVCGFTVPPADADALGRALKRLLEDESLRKEFGKNARERMLENFTSGKMAEAVFAVYEKLSQRGNK